ncbi:MAG: hypothetical protein IBX55_15190 [Methyloprofundus sp.]|nr:hypothetical protein [Methyloprofundus sp.]
MAKNTIIEQLREQLEQSLAGRDLNDLAKNLGYARTDAFINHIQNHILSDAYLGLNSTHFDKRYFTKELWQKLVVELNIPKSLLDEVVEELEQSIKAYERHRPYLNIQTDFDLNKNSQPLFALSGLVSRFKYIKIDFQHFKPDKKQMFQYLSKLIRSHFNDTGGKLSFWGNIQNYDYHHSDGSVMHFDINGQVKS